MKSILLVPLKADLIYLDDWIDLPTYSKVLEESLHSVYFNQKYILNGKTKNLKFLIQFKWDAKAKWYLTLAVIPVAVYANGFSLGTT